VVSISSTRGRNFLLHRAIAASTIPIGQFFIPKDLERCRTRGNVNLLPVTREETAQTIMMPRSTAGMTTKVVKGGAWTLIGQLAPMVVSLVTTPFVIRMLGTEGYGVVALISLIPAYLTFADLGMGLASTKFGSEAFAAGHLDKEANVVKTALLVTLLVAVPIASSIFLFSDFLTRVLNVPERLHSDANLAFKFAAVSLVFYLLNNVVNTPQLARLRMDLNSFVNSGTRILGLIAAPVVIYLGGGLAGAVFALMAANGIAFVFHLLVSGRLNPRIFEFSITPNVIRPLLNFGSSMTLSAIAAVLLTHMEKLVLTRQTSVEQLAYYSVAFTLSNAAALFGVSMSQAIVPAFSQLLSPDRRDQLLTLYTRTLRITLFGLLPMVAILFVTARGLFTLWAGPEFGVQSTIPFYILLCGLIFNLNAYVPSGLVLASGRSDIFAKLYWIELFPYILLTAFFTGRYGAVGAAAAWSIRTIVDAVAFFWLARRVCRVTIDTRRLAFQLAGSAAVLLIPIILTLSYSEFGISIPVAALLLSLAIYALLMWKWIFTSEEKRWLAARFDR
jgi:O-antigen/teichoic acid export membrane protein